MKKEQIEKAANAYIDDFLDDHIDYTVINNEEDNYEAGRSNALCEFGADIFKAGVEWCTNSVWHGANEEPKHGEHILVRFKSGNFTSWFVSTDICSVFKRFEVVAWAYIDDLLPNKED